MEHILVAFLVLFEYDYSNYLLLLLLSLLLKLLLLLLLKLLLLQLLIILLLIVGRKFYKYSVCQLNWVGPSDA
jgi:hypothetical protein